MSAVVTAAATFTVINSGGEIGARRASELLGVVTAWTAAAGPETARVVEVWSPCWRSLLAGCMGTAVGTGGMCAISPSVVDDFVAGLRARGISVRHRRARLSMMIAAELRAICQDRPVLCV